MGFKNFFSSNHNTSEKNQLNTQLENDSNDFSMTSCHNSCNHHDDGQRTPCEHNSYKNCCCNVCHELEELEQGIAGVEHTLKNPLYGLYEIKNEIRNIECAVLDPTFGLEEIQEEIRSIENTVNAIQLEVDSIWAALNNQDHGLVEIKSEIRNIEAGVASLIATLY